MKNYILTLSILLFLSACIKKQEPVIKALINDNNSIVIPLNNLNVEIVHADSLFEVVSFIKPELTDKSMIGNYSKIIVKDEKIFIMDDSKSNQAIFVFNMQGKFLFSINARGNGPGEYISVEDFFVDEENKIIGILDHSRIHIYDFNGSFIRKLDLMSHLISKIAFADGKIYAYTFSQCPTKLCYALKIFNMQGDLLYEDIPIRKDLITFPYTGFKPNNLYTDSDNQVYFNSIYNDTVYRVGINKISPVYIADFGKHKFPEKIFSDFVERKDNNMDKTSRELYNTYSEYAQFGINNIYFTKDYVYFDFLAKNITYKVYFSKKTKSVKIINQINTRNQLFPTIVNASDKNFFYGAVYSSDFVDTRNKIDEYLIANPQIKFTSAQRKYYDTFLKDAKAEDNTTLIVFKLKDF